MIRRAIICLLLTACSPVMADGPDVMEPAACPEAPQAVSRPETWLIVGQSNIERGVMVVELTRSLAKAGRPIAALVATEGSTTIACWRRGGRCYETYVAPYLGLEIDGVFYWQGESDANAQDGGTWHDFGQSFTQLITEYREDFDDVPFVYVTLQNYDADLFMDGFQEPESAVSVREQQGQALLMPDVFTVDARPYSTGSWDLGPEQYDNIAADAVDVIEKKVPVYGN